MFGVSNNVKDWRAEFKRLEGAYAPSTLKPYFADIEIYENWCLGQGLDPFPASVAVICHFLEEQAPGKAPSTVRRRLYAIRKAHRLLRLPDPTWDEDINITFRRIRRAKFTRPKQAKGLTRKYLDAFLAVQPETPWGLRNRAMLSLGYELLTRFFLIMAVPAIAAGLAAIPGAILYRGGWSLTDVAMTIVVLGITAIVTLMALPQVLARLGNDAQHEK